jgi:hypothetical protein
MWIFILLFIFYTIICSFLVSKNAIVKASNIPSKVIITLFLIKLSGGLLYHYINTVRFYGGDSHQLFIETVDYLNTDSTYFWNYFFKGWSGFNWNENIFSVANAKSWSNLSNQVNYRFLTICNVLSFKTEIINYIFYNTIFFIGEMALFCTFQKSFPNRKSLILIFIFCTPSIWFWCSGVHKDGFVLSFIGFLLYYCMKYFDTKKWKYGIGIILFLFANISIRYYITIALLPCLLLYLLASKKPKHSVFIFTLGLLLFIISFFNLSAFTSINPPEIICFKQADFLSAKGDSYIPTSPLQPTAISFLKNIPMALNHCLMRPYIWESKDTMYFICSVETFILFTLLLFLLFKIPLVKWRHPLFLFCICLSMIMFIIIGYIVPFSGAFIRYRSEYYPFIFGVLLGSSKWKILDLADKKADSFIFKK